MYVEPDVLFTVTIVVKQRKGVSAGCLLWCTQTPNLVVTHLGG